MPDLELGPHLVSSAGDHDFLFTRPTELPDVAHRILASDDLAEWIEIHPVQELTAQAGGREQVRWGNVRAAASDAGLVNPEQLFFRLAVDLVPMTP